MSSFIEILIIASLVSVACSLCGNFLVLRKMSMVSDSITHTILLGIAIGFLISGSLSSPLLIIGAGAIGVLTVFLSQTLNQTKLLSEDASIGVIFPLLFSIAVILITQFASDVHLDTDSVLLGELAYAPFDRLIFFGVDIGAVSIYSGLIMLAINLLFIVLFYRHLFHSSFDFNHSAVLGFMPTILFYAFMTIVSTTAVVSFSSVGSVFVVAFMIVPPATSFLVTDNLKFMITLSSILSIIGSVLGYGFAMLFDVSIAGAIATTLGAMFMLALFFNTNNGIIANIFHKSKRKTLFANDIVIFKLSYLGRFTKEKTLFENINLSRSLIKKSLKTLVKNEYIYKLKNSYSLSKSGYKYVDMLIS